MALLEIIGIGKRYDGVCALEDVSMRLEAGEVHCLAGENGSGKSTLIKTLAGVIHPDSGQILLDGRVLPPLRPPDARRLGIQVIFQESSLFPQLSVAENLAMGGARLSGFVNWRVIRRLAREALAKLEVEIALDQPVAGLSTANKQVVAIGRALLQQTRVLIMDEPTAALTGRDVEVLFSVVRRLKESGVAILFVSHRLDEMLRISDRFSFLRGGRLVATGPAADFDHAAITRHLTGQDPSPPPPRGGPRNDDPLLRVRSLRGAIVQDASFDLAAGEIVGITGLRGAGQAELALLLSGARARTGGEVLLAGASLPNGDLPATLAAGIAYVPEDRLTEGLALDQSLAFNLASATLSSFGGWGGLVRGTDIAAHAQHWLNDLGVRAPSPKLPVRALSGGNQQRVALGKWLCTRPRVLILNGPTVGVDVGSKRAIHDRLRALASQGLAVLLISDDLTELAESCQRVLVMHQGRIADTLIGDGWNDRTLAAQLNQLR